MTDLLDSARLRMAKVHPHALHLESTLHWTLQLDGNASEALRIAAVTHDIERAFPDPEAQWDSARDWDDPAYVHWHQERCADMIAAWLREQDAPPALVEAVSALVRVHEEGGWPDADLLQSADSLSFLEVMTPLVVGWVESGRASRERARGKVRHSYERMKLPRARELGWPLLQQSLTELDAAAPVRS
jgi:hypothetical protein